MRGNSIGAEAAPSDAVGRREEGRRGRRGVRAVRVGGFFGARWLRAGSLLSGGGVLSDRADKYVVGPLLELLERLPYHKLQHRVNSRQRGVRAQGSAQRNNEEGQGLLAPILRLAAVQQRGADAPAENLARPISTG